MLSLAMLTDNVENIFGTLRTTETFVELNEIPVPMIELAGWQLDQSWQEILQQRNERKIQLSSIELRRRQCTMHMGEPCPIGEEEIGHTLDQQFRFFLYLARPYVSQLSYSMDREKAVQWVAVLCSIDHSACVLSKGIRNDYMITLLGYLSCRLLLGPFEKYPCDVLPPLGVAAERCMNEANRMPMIDPNHPHLDQIISRMPKPEEGTFAVLAISGDF